MTVDEDNSEFQQAVELLCAANKIVVFTGAGISLASGIATFRDPDGFWKKFPPDEFANWKGLLQVALLEPKRFADFLLAVIKPIAIAKPNAAHQALAQLQSAKQVTVVTQNIDRLHHDAGSEIIHEVHGNLFDIINVSNGELLRTHSRSELLDIVEQIEAAREEFWTGPRLLNAVKPMIGFDGGGIHRPNLVLFGDQLAEPDWSKATAATNECDLFLSIGTSQSVHPAAGLVSLARDNGAKIISVDPTTGNGDVWLQGNAEDVIPKLIDQVLTNGEKSDG